MLVLSLPMKSRKSLAHDIFSTFATHSGLVRDVTDRLLGTKWQNLWSSNFQNVIFGQVSK